MALILIADAAGHTGLSHIQKSCPPEDFTLARNTPLGACVVVCDGCSHGEVDDDNTLRQLGIVYHTNLGAALLATAAPRVAKALLPTLADAPDPARTLRNAIRAAQRQMMENTLTLIRHRRRLRIMRKIRPRSGHPCSTASGSLRMRLRMLFQAFGGSK